MVWLVILYSLGVIISLHVYRTHFQNSVPIHEIALTWFYQLPVMLIAHYKHQKHEKQVAEKKAEIWYQSFKETCKIAKDENWSEEDWQRWNASIEYSTSLNVRY